MGIFLGLLTAALFWHATVLYSSIKGDGTESRPWLAIFFGVIVWLLALAGGFWLFLAFLCTGYEAYVWFDTWKKRNHREDTTKKPLQVSSHVPEPQISAQPKADSTEIDASRRQSLAAMKRATKARREDISARSKPPIHKTTSFPIAKPNKFGSTHFDEFYDKAMDISLLVEKQPESSNRKSISKPMGGIMRKDISDVRSNFNSKMRLDRAADQLIGICGGIVADGRVNKEEVAFLSTWLADHREVCSEFPGKALADRISAIMDDGIISDDELQDLFKTLQQISGNHFIETGAATPESPAIQADSPDVIEFVDRRFCLTGKFVFGSRTKCQEATTRLGAGCDGDVTLQTDYLVIGALVSPDWKHETYGRKIERAMSLRDGGAGKPVIITEEQWAVYIS